jgi:ribosomal-protein-alanine N-acetyltransferase
MLVFKTERLEIREMQARDLDYFIELLSAPEIINPIPQPKWNRIEILDRFADFSNYSSDPLSKEKVIWGVYEGAEKELIGLCALLTNDEHQREIGYRFRPKYWGLGYATELTHSLITHCFARLGLSLVTADVNVTNFASVKILEKFFHPVREFRNQRDNCTDRRYLLTVESWKSRQKLSESV